ncbi:Protein rds1 [Penicillium longicatenatum]|uniref:Protein rds1 n=1 Tax=Penicillium longicatenatum TaxID=1561947 RepID=UPI0025484275|nr:Protein rds1 [Penicillium longicatenatum]KAJ5636816.1 Protein rds1 [Penicillium longicatenatum]
MTNWNSALWLGVLGMMPLASASPLRSESAPPTASHPASLPHTPFTGTPTTTGALTASSIGTGVVESASIAAAETTYASNGELQNAEPAPYTPAGGVGTEGQIPVYNAKSDFDYESLALALYQEWIELDLFQDGLRRFSAKDFEDAGLNAADRELIAFMAEQEVGHATLISNMLGADAPKQCQYDYPYTNVQEYLDFCQKLTRFGESGVYGFLGHLDSREAATLLTQSITTEARQQMIFRQFEGLFPMPVWFEVGVPQSWAWTLLAPYISSCPADQTRLVWQNFPALWIENQPTLADAGKHNNGTAFNNTLAPGMNVAKASSKENPNSNNGASGASVTPEGYSPLSFPGRRVDLRWEEPGKAVGPNNSYVTSTQAGEAKFVAWASQLNVTYTPLLGVHGSSGYTIQPDMETYEGDPAVNGTMFIAITDSDTFLTPFNLSMINTHVVAGPALYQAD